MMDPEFDAGIERLAGVFGPFPDALVTELKRNFIGLDSRLWHRVCSEIIDTCRFSPKVVNFRKVLRDCLEGWRHESPENECALCEGRRLVDAYYTIDGKPWSGVAPCRCNPVKLQSRENAPEQVPISREEYLQLKHGDDSGVVDPDIARMGPHGAKFTLDLMDRHGTHGMPEHNIKALAYKAAEHVEKTCAHCTRQRPGTIGSALATLDRNLNPPKPNALLEAFPESQ